MNSKYYHPRTCTVCGQGFDGMRNVCEPCRYREGKGLPVLIGSLRDIALAGATGRIHAEMAAIRRAGMNPDTATIDEIRAAGLMF